MLSLGRNWHEMVELISVGGFTCVVLIRLSLSSYYLKHRPTKTSPERGFVRPYPVRTTAVYLTEREARLVGPILRNVAITFWVSGLVTFLVTRR
jgi:hypothetical protein